MTDLIQTINTIRNVPHSGLRSLVKRVVVILTSPRSGSSLLKSVLESHPDIASMDGEIEPFLPLTRNGFGYNSDSDAVHVLSNINDLADNIFDDLTVCSDEFPPLSFLKQQWEKRLLVQFPGLFSKKLNHERLIQSLDEALAKISAQCIRRETEVQACILSGIFRNEPWRISYYDGHAKSGERKWFNENLKIEEPPFVVPRLYRKLFTKDDTETKTLLFKTPPDVYRIGMYEQLFPNADIKYLHLTRGYAQTVNGLIDGWLSPIGFFSCDMQKVGVCLDIKGYSDLIEFGKRWWKFDLPPNWRDFATANLEDVCLNQWMSAHKAILGSPVRALRISFEEFLSSPATAMIKLTDYLGLPKMQLQSTLPIVMSVETPKLGRWRKRERLLTSMGKSKEVREMMEWLGYEMDPQTWL